MQGRFLDWENSIKSCYSQEKVRKSQGKCKRGDEKLRVLKTVMKRVARVLGTICVGTPNEPSRRGNREAHCLLDTA